MALPAVRLGGGVWKHQEEIRAELQRRLDESEGLWRDATAEVDRVHAQCMVLLRDNSELRNVAELMALLTRANEDRSRLESELGVATLLWQQTRDQHRQATSELEKLRLEHEDEELESRRLRDLFYESQEKNECQAQDLARLQRQLRVLAHNNEAKDRQVITLIRERDAYAQKIAQYRSRLTEVTPQPRRLQTEEKQPDDVTWTDVSPTQRLRVLVHQTKAAFERERETNAVLQTRVDALEKGHAELLVRSRQASKLARRHRIKLADNEKDASASTNVAAA